MFGTAESWRKQYGAGTLYAQRLPSLVETDLRAVGGTDAVDHSRLVTLGGLLVQRTGKSLEELWHVVSGGSVQCPYDQIAPKLNRAGVGLLVPREWGVLERVLRPDQTGGMVTYTAWMATFSPGAQVAADEARGALVEPAGQAPKDNRKPAGEGPHMVGGHSERDFLSPRPLEQSAAAAARVDEWHRSGGSQPPFATTGDDANQLATSSRQEASIGSPTFGITTDRPPFATSGASIAPCGLDSRGSSTSSIPYATSDNIYFQPADVSYGSRERRSEKRMPVKKDPAMGSAPFATGNGWA